MNSARPSAEGLLGRTLLFRPEVLRSHFHEKSATELYNELGQASQGGKEDPTEFLLRLLSLKQKIQLVSKEVGSEIIYDSKLIDSMFKRTLYTGLREDSFRRELQPLLERKMSVVRDEDLTQKTFCHCGQRTRKTPKIWKTKSKSESSEYEPKYSKSS